MENLVLMNIPSCFPVEEKGLANLCTLRWSSVLDLLNIFNSCEFKFLYNLAFFGLG